MTFFELARDGRRARRVPELRFVNHDAVGPDLFGPCPIERWPRDVAEVLDKAFAGERIDEADALTLLESRELVPIGRAADELRSRKTDPEPGDVHHRPEPQLHEHLLHGLRLLRVLPVARRQPRGLPAPEAGDLQEDRGDARARRHRAPHAGGPPSGPRDRLLRGSLPLDQGPLPGSPPRALAARDPARRAPFEADRSPRR